MISVDVNTGGKRTRVVFSGDIGQKDKPILRDPAAFTEADYVVIESTYGDRIHDKHEDVETQLIDIVNEAFSNGGNVVMPVFAVERSQELIYAFGRLMHEKRIPRIPVYLDSPMAAKATEVFKRHRECYDAEAREMIANGQKPLSFPELKLSRTTDESKAINKAKSPVIIMSTSGMCTAGRIKHHLAHNITKKEASLVFCGYQAHGTLGRLILEGKKEIRIHGRYLPVRATVRQINGVSGHADQPALLAWLAGFSKKPKRVFVVHGGERFSQDVRGTGTEGTEVGRGRAGVRAGDRDRLVWEGRSQQAVGRSIGLVHRVSASPSASCQLPTALLLTLPLCHSAPLPLSHFAPRICFSISIPTSSLHASISRR